MLFGRDNINWLLNKDQPREEHLYDNDLSRTATLRPDLTMTQNRIVKNQKQPQMHFFPNNRNLEALHYNTGSLSQDLRESLAAETHLEDLFINIQDETIKPLQAHAAKLCNDMHKKLDDFSEKLRILESQKNMRIGRTKTVEKKQVIRRSTQSVNIERQSGRATEKAVKPKRFSSNSGYLSSDPKLKESTPSISDKMAGFKGSGLASSSDGVPPFASKLTNFCDSLD